MKYYFLILLACCFSCKKNNSVNKIPERNDHGMITENPDTLSTSGTGFDKTKWLAKDDHHYPYRNEMLSVLLNNHMLDSLNKDQVLHLLGHPDRTDNNYLFYQIAQKRLGFWPLHTKTMVIKFHDDHVLEWVRIHE